MNGEKLWNEYIKHVGEYQPLVFISLFRFIDHQIFLQISNRKAAFVLLFLFNFLLSFTPVKLLKKTFLG